MDRTFIKNTIFSVLLALVLCLTLVSLCFPRSARADTKTPEEYEQTIAELETRLDELSLKIVELMTELEEKNSRITELETRLATLEKQNAEQSERLANDIADIRAERDGLKQRLLELTNSINSSEEELLKENLALKELLAELETDNGSTSEEEKDDGNVIDNAIAGIKNGCGCASPAGDGTAAGTTALILGSILFFVIVRLRGRYAKN